MIPCDGKVLLTDGNTFIGCDEIVDGAVDFWFALPAGTHTLKAEFTSFDRTQHAVAPLVMIALGAAVTLLAGAVLLLRRIVKR